MTQKLEVVNLACGYGDKELFSNLDFSIESGEIVRIDGKNGSGKTTLIRAVCGLKWAFSGKILWCDEDIKDIRHDYNAQTAYVGHLNGIKGDLTPLENLCVTQGISVPKSEKELLDALHKTGLKGYEHEFCRTLSSGQKRRVALARLLISDAKLWILDEPFTGIDKAGRKNIISLLLEHIKIGGMVILTTHLDLDIKGVRTIHIVL